MLEPVARSDAEATEGLVCAVLSWNDTDARRALHIVSARENAIRRNVEAGAESGARRSGDEQLADRRVRKERRIRYAAAPAFAAALPVGHECDRRSRIRRLIHRLH